ncbi:hypothetical protein CK203_063160 [Vitis vinifera]|uniref:Uncharacterized protein n=1 Tax=Vitis vinifera TaxID=29760 RepID=A0A438FRF9_VITVI|nr:hypothetical protein CK203_063160 [Vitis vinifera]
MQGSGGAAGGLEGQDAAGRAWRCVGRGRKVSHAPAHQPPAVRNMWSVPGKEVAGKIRRKGLPVAGKIRRKGCRRGGDPTAMRLSGVVLIMDKRTIKVMSYSCKMADITEEGVSCKKTKGHSLKA